jgi:hypothetical protein
LSTFLVLAMTQTTNLSLGNEPTGVAIPSDPYSPRFIFGIQQNNVGYVFIEYEFDLTKPESILVESDMLLH